MAKQIIIKGTPVVAANEVLVADSNSKIPAVDGSLVTTMAGGNITGTVPTARLDTGTTANKLVVLTGSGLPAVDGSLLTGIVSHTTSASDPTISTNPATGVGAEWINSTSGKQFICTDATAGANVWTCSGGGSGSVSPFHFTNAQLYCFAPGGNTGGDTNQLHIDKTTFASDGNSTDHGDQTVARRGQSHSSSTTHGYSSGGYGQNPTGQSNIIDKFAMATTSNATDVGDLTVAGETHAGVTSTTHGHACGGGQGLRRVDKYAFATDGNATNIGNLLSVNRDYPMGGCSQTHGYILGSNSGAPTNQIEKFSFADDSTTADVGDVVGTKCGSSSHMQAGYVWNAGAFHAGDATDRIDKMATASDSDSVDSTSNLSVTVSGPGCGNSSSTYGYSMGGRVSSNHANVIDKWPFASSSTATDVGDLIISTESVMFSGNQI